MEMQVFIKPKPEKRTLKYFSIPSEPKKKEAKPKEFFYIGTDKKIISLLLNNFDSGFCSEDLQKGSQIVNMLISRKISLPDVIIIQHGFRTEDLTGFFLALQQKIQLIPVIIEGNGATESALQQLKYISFIDDVFTLNENNVSQLIKKIGFLKKMKASTPSESNNAFDVLPNQEEGQIKHYSKKLFDILVSLARDRCTGPCFFNYRGTDQTRIEGPGAVLFSPCRPRVPGI